MKTESRNFWGAAHPELDRLLIGLWYIPIGIIAHFVIVLTGSPTVFNALANSAYLPFYRVFFAQMMAANVTWFAAAIMLVDVMLGLLIFARGVAVKLGLLLSAVFQVAVAPLGVWGVINIVLALVCMMLIQYDYEKNILEVFAARRNVTLSQSRG